MSRRQSPAHERGYLLGNFGENSPFLPGMRLAETPVCPGDHDDWMPRSPRSNLVGPPAEVEVEGRLRVAKTWRTSSQGRADSAWPSLANESRTKYPTPIKRGCVPQHHWQIATDCSLRTWWSGSWLAQG